jgi:hypothetical protein
MSEPSRPSGPPPLPPFDPSPGAPTPPLAQPLGYAHPYPPGSRPPEDPKARRLVRISEIMGWGGLLLLVLGPPGAGLATGSGVVAGAVAVIAVVSLVVGAVIGQIGRAMQGRVV